MKIARYYFLATAVLAGCLLFSCAEKKPQEPPRELLDEVASIEALYQEASRLGPSEKDASSYHSLMGSVRGAIDAGDYKTAADKARFARLEALRLYGLLTMRELDKYNPPNNLTYHYRQNDKTSDEAEAKGDIGGAIRASKEALRQADLSLSLQMQCIEKAGKDLALLKKQIEAYYRPDFEILNLFWNTVSMVKDKDCTKAGKMLGELTRRVEYAQRNVIGSSRTFAVSSPPEFVRTYGDPVMYKEATAKGLSGELTRIPVGRRVIFIRTMLLSRAKTYYYVRDTRTGLEGWMAEERIWPERAKQH